MLQRGVGPNGLVLLTDISDTLFQADPFSLQFDRKTLYVSAEANVYGDARNPSSVGNIPMLQSDGRDRSCSVCADGGAASNMLMGSGLARLVAQARTLTRCRLAARSANWAARSRLWRARTAPSVLLGCTPTN